MDLRKLTTGVTGGLALACALTVSLVAGQQSTKPMAGHEMGRMAESGIGTKMTKAQKIANALSAAPASVSGKATILDFPSKEGMAPPVLRAGTNGWSCFPDMPDTKGNDPMCVDDPWMKWIEAYLSHKPVQIDKLGVGYMLAPGGGWGSNTDPYATKETPDNQWGHAGPHLMIVVPDSKALAGISTDPTNGGPWVMFANTPYAHIMAPITAPAMKH
jgi:hypothetical protein